MNNTKTRSFKEQANEMLDNDKDFQRLDPETQQDIRNFANKLADMESSDLFKELRNVLRKALTGRDEKDESELHISTTTQQTGKTNVINFQGNDKGFDVKFSFTVITKGSIDVQSTAMEIAKTIFHVIKKEKK